MVGLLAVLLALAVGVPLGVLAALRKGTWIDLSITVIVLTGLSVPTFVTGTFLLIVFAVWLHAAPVGGWGTLAHLPLPVITLAVPFTVYITRLTRAGMVDVLAAPFLRTAAAKGLPPRRIVLRHALPVAFLPVWTYLGPAVAQAVTGSFIVEKIFGVPGMGQHFVRAALNRDPGLMMSTVLVFAVILVAMNLLVDLTYAVVDPRIREAA